MDLIRLLDNVLELPGVDGLCLLDADGGLRLDRMPDFVGAELLGAARPHLAALRESAETCLPGTEDLVLRFAEHWLMLRRAAGATLLLLGGAAASLSSVRMVSNIALRQLDGAALAALPVQAPPAAEVGHAPPAARAPRMYRGRPY